MLRVEVSLGMRINLDKSFLILVGDVLNVEALAAEWVAE